MILLMRLFPYSRIGRVAVTMVLLLATQLAFAGQVCRAVMVGSVLDSRPAEVLDQTAHSTAAAAGSRPCCDGCAMPANMCLLTALGDTSVIALPAGGAPLLDLAPPVRDCSTPAIVGTSSVSIPLPATSVGHPPPSYIVFHRFLS